MKRSPLVILFVTNVIDLLGFGIILPLLPLYIKRFGGTPFDAGMLTASYSIMQFIFAPIWGRMSDIYGRRPIILLSLIGSAVAFTLFGMANSLTMLFAARLAGGILTSASLPTSYAYIADVTTPEKRARGMALIGVAFGIGFAFGPIMGSYLGRFGLHVPALTVGGIALLNFTWSLFALPETHTNRSEKSARRVEFFDMGRLKEAFRTPALKELLSVFCVSTFAFALLESTFTWLILLRFLNMSAGTGVITEDQAALAAPIVGPIFAIIGITILVVQGSMMSGLAHRIGERLLVRVGAVTLTVAMFGIGFALNLTELKLLAMLVAVGSGMLNPSLTSLISRVADPAERGSIMGVQQGLGSFARIIAPLLGTWMLRKGTPGVPFGMPYYVSGALMAVAFVLSLTMKPMVEGLDS